MMVQKIRVFSFGKSSVWIKALCLCLFLTFASGGLAQTPTKTCAAKDQSAVLSLHGYTFRAYRNDEKACLRVFHEGKQIYSSVEEGGTASFTLGKIGDVTSPGGVVPGTDVTGRGHPDVIVSYYSGGAHCCEDFLVFELEPNFSLMARIAAGNADGSVFRRDPHDRRYRFETADNTFAYWHMYFAGSPLIGILLEAVDDGKGGVRFRLATEKMHKPAPTEDQWRRIDLRLAKEAFQKGEAFENYYAGAGLWGTMLDRIYAGQDAWAWKTLDAAWPEKKPGKEVFLKEFCQTLQSSPYWSDLKPTITAAPPVCAQVFSQPFKNSNN
jgi:hypothetical protein